MEIVTNKIIIPTLRRLYKFVHVSDLHIAHSYETDCAEAKATADKQAIRWTQKYTPKDALSRIIEHVDGYNPDAVFVTGDAVDYFSSSNISYLSGELRKIQVPVIYTYGNHESAYGYYPGAPFTKANYHFYEELTRGNPSHRSIDMEDLIIAVIDDSDKKITAEQLDFIHHLGDDGRPVLLLCHIPLRTEANEAEIMRVWGSTFLIGTDDDSDITNSFCQFIKSEESNVKAIFSGHIHFSDTGEFAPGRLQFCAAPSFSGFIRNVELKPE